MARPDRPPLRTTAVAVMAATLLLAAAGAARAQIAPRVSAPPGPAETACPQGLPEGVRCLGGRDHLGAWYLIAVPRAWSGVLVMHVHGGPSLGEPRASRVTQDLQRWSVVLRAGHAWAGSSFRQGGFEVLDAGQDTERLRRLAVETIGPPKLTLLHGQSWGASVAARMAERYVTPDVRPGQAAPGGKPYDAVLLTSGVLAGATRAYDVRLDLRVVYQALCGNHPRPDETPYPSWMGLPLESRLTREALAERVDECTGVRRPAAERTAAQQRRLDQLVRVLRLPASSLVDHLAWATWHFQELSMRRLKGRSALGNEGVRYTGSDDDDDLNRRVERIRADPAARAELARDGDPTGALLLPTLTLHGIDDPVAFVEMTREFRDLVADAGASDRLAQAWTTDATHSYFTDAAYVTAIDALVEWVTQGRRPDPASLAQRCRALPAVWHPARDCRYAPPSWEPQPLDRRVPRRHRAEPPAVVGAPAASAVFAPVEVPARAASEPALRRP
ncbi:MAG: hypothetical protein RL456_578 [Pseudomonadota bacterium]